MKNDAMHAAELSDADLVAESLSGNRDAFVRIVERYQTLIASLAYCATGNVSQSEDLGQQTFFNAWKQLAELREPAKLRPWLCSIARSLITNEFRRQGREPDHAAESLEALDEWVSPEPLPPDQVISDEEKAILWRSLERIPEIYREPLVLFYREHQSVEAVAQDLGLSEDAVKQRLSRGRKLLQERFLAFVAGALKQTSPGKAFTLGVIAGLPLLATTAKAATVGTVLAKHGSVAAKTTGSVGYLQAIANFIMGMVYWVAAALSLGGYIGYKMGGDRQNSERARRSVATFWRNMGASMLVLVILPALLLSLLEHRMGARIIPFARFYCDFLIPVFIYGVAPLSLVIWTWQRRRRIGPETDSGAQISSPGGKHVILWVVLAMTGALVCLASAIWTYRTESRLRLPKTQFLSTAEVQNLIANSKGRDIRFFLNQCQKGFCFLDGEVREDATPVSTFPSYCFDAPAENSTLALLTEKGIRYKTIVNNRDFSLASQAVLWLRRWALLSLMVPFCFFIVVAGAVTLMRRRNNQPSEARLIAAARNERRVDKAFAALVACGMVVVAVFLSLTTDWKVRRVAADQVPGIIAQHRNARFEVFEYPDGSRKLWISDLRSPDFIAPADESTLGLLTGQGLTYQTYLEAKIGHQGPRQSTSLLAILLLAVAAGRVLWWVVKSRPTSTLSLQPTSRSADCS
jgi:RNA polymerase sigma factor (sigma-70 family)